MTDAAVLRWRDAMPVCLGAGEVKRLARHLARLPEGERRMLLDGIDSDLLRVAVDSLLRQNEQQLALV